MLVAQAGCCLICKQNVKLDVDHDHVTKAVRGLLCRHCNLGLGAFSDSPGRLRQAATYLEERK